MGAAMNYKADVTTSIDELIRLLSSDIKIQAETSIMDRSLESGRIQCL